MMPAFESMALPPIWVEVGSSLYWPIMHQEPSAATLTRGKGVGTATMPMAYN